MGLAPDLSLRGHRTVARLVGRAGGGSSCSNLVLTSYKKLHTMRAPGKCWCTRCLVARQDEGRGSCLFPASSLTRLGRVAPTFPSRRTSMRLFLLPGCAGAKPPPPDNPFFDAISTLIGRQRNCSSACRFIADCPTLRMQICFRRSAGTPRQATRPLRRSHALPRSARAGRAAGVSPPLAAPRREQLFSPSCSSIADSALLHAAVLLAMTAAGRRAVLQLVHRGACLWCHQAGRLLKLS